MTDCSPRPVTWLICPGASCGDCALLTIQAEAQHSASMHHCCVEQCAHTYPQRCHTLHRMMSYHDDHARSCIYIHFRCERQAYRQTCDDCEYRHGASPTWYRMLDDSPIKRPHTSAVFTSGGGVTSSSLGPLICRLQQAACATQPVSSSNRATTSYACTRQV